MVQRSAAIFVHLAVVQLLLGALPPPVVGESASMCLSADQASLTADDIQIQVIIGAGDTVIVGGQFTVRYDPRVLTLTDAVPGRACDVASPFALEVLEVDDRSIGEVQCAFGVDFEEGLPPAALSTTLACLNFALTGDSTSPTSVCLLKGENPFLTVLVDSVGHAVQIDNSEACPPDERPPILTCIELTPDDGTHCVPDTADCHDLDSPCRTGVCDPLTLRCEVVFVNEGGPCDDGEFCTLADYCRAGECVGDGCRASRHCANSASCREIIQPDIDDSRVVHQGSIPVQ